MVLEDALNRWTKTVVGSLVDVRGGGGMTRRQEGRDGEEGSEVSGPWREVSKKWRRSACEIVRSGGFRGNPNLALPHAAIYVV